MSIATTLNSTSKYHANLSFNEKELGLETLNTYIQGTKDKARLRLLPQTESHCATFYARTGDLPKRFYEWLTSGFTEAKSKRQAAQKQIERVLDKVGKHRASQDIQQHIENVRQALYQNESNLCGCDIDIRELKEKLAVLTDAVKAEEAIEARDQAPEPLQVRLGMRAAPPAAPEARPPVRAVPQSILFEREEPASRAQAEVQQFLLLPQGEAAVQGAAIALSESGADPAAGALSVPGGEKAAAANLQRFDGDHSGDLRTRRRGLVVPQGATVACWRKAWQVAADVFIIPRHKLFGTGVTAQGNWNGFQFSNWKIGADQSKDDLVRHQLLGDSGFILGPDPEAPADLEQAYRARLQEAMALPEKPKTLLLAPFSGPGKNIKSEEDAAAIGRAVAALRRSHPEVSIQVVTEDIHMKGRIQAQFAHCLPAGL